MKKSLFTALRFLTILPISKEVAVRERDLAESTCYFPLVGALIGLLLVAVDIITKPFFPAPIVNLFILIALIATTGALHLDGFMDSADGLFSGRSKDKILEIMRDSRVGAFGILAVICLLLTKLSFLNEIPINIRYQNLILMPTLSRWVVVYAAYMYPYARREEGKGKPFAELVGKKEFLIATLITAALTIILLGLNGIIVWILTFLALALLCRWINKKIGGMTGDTFGAVAEVAEVVVLVTAYFLS